MKSEIKKKVSDSGPRFADAYADDMNDINIGGKKAYDLRGGAGIMVDQEISAFRSKTRGKY